MTTTEESGRGADRGAPRPRAFIPLVALGCLAALVLGCFGPVLFRGRQFAFRDAGHYYYPLYQLVQQEWRAGRWPLWMSGGNAGMPLLANPTAAVLYPGKLIYAVLPYAWAARVYVVAHVLLAFAAMVALLRHWGISTTGAVLGGLSYAFSGPLLFLYSNVVFLVGAAWAPLGLRAIDRWARQERLRGLVELSAVLAMQVLGGDPEAAYIVVIAGAGYAVGRSAASLGAFGWALVLAALLALYAVELFFAARAAATLKEAPLGGAGEGWGPASQVVAVVAWGLIVLHVGRRGASLGRGLAGLAGAAVLALGLAAAQLGPCLELARLSLRAAEVGPHDIYPFSIRPQRVVEWAWPNVFGTLDQGNRAWLAALPPGQPDTPWTPSLYGGGLALVLALAAAGFRDGNPGRGWLTALAVVGLLAGLGEYGSPLYWARQVPAWVPTIGPLDPPMDESTRKDGFLRDGDGGVYWFLAATLPGFRSFRYPSKLLALTSLGLAGLAGLGWDRLSAGAARRASAWAFALLVATLSALAALALGRGWLGGYLTARAPRAATYFGPLDVAGALADAGRALIQATLIMVLALALIRLAMRRPRLAGTLALVVSSLDLLTANARLVWTVPQSLFEGKPRLVRLIEAAERADPAPGPFRIHRMPVWYPRDWYLHGSDRRLEEITRWERDTLQPQYAINYGLGYVFIMGPTELFDYTLFFDPHYLPADDRTARGLNLAPGERLVYYPRRSFDLWGARYFILPAQLVASDQGRGFASFLPRTEAIAPAPREFQGPDAASRRARWQNVEDVCLLRNSEAYPRAWIVHRARYPKPIRGLRASDRESFLVRLIFQGGDLWNPQDRPAFDPLQVASIETDRGPELARFLARARTGPDPSESVKINRDEPNRVELTAVLRSPGVVVLSDVDYPGWDLAIDGQPAEVLRVNRLMRGAAVDAGIHHLVYTYRPYSFYYGVAVSLASLLVLAGLVFWSRR